MSICRSLAKMERVLNVFPQLQVTVISLYRGCISDFMSGLPYNYYETICQ
jgi:hypothetical protein